MSFTVRAGEVLGLYGFMGSGQLELAKALMGKLVPELGSMRIGRPAGAAHQHQRAPSGPGSRSCRRAGARCCSPRSRSTRTSRSASWSGSAACSCGRPRSGGSPRRQVDALRIRPYSVEPELRTLSGGNQQKVALARWLTHLPRVLVLAEPTRGMDVGAKDDVVKIVRGLKEQGVGVVVASAEPETVLALADRILVLRKGAVTREFRNETVSKDRLLAAA